MSAINIEKKMLHGVNNSNCINDVNESSIVVAYGKKVTKVLIFLFGMI